MAHPPTPEFAAFVGLDWADAKHDVCLQAAGSQTREFSVLEHQPDTIEAWVSTYIAIRDGTVAEVTDDVRRVTGRAPRTLERALKP
jgi:hypothetical protein